VAEYRSAHRPKVLGPLRQCLLGKLGPSRAPDPTVDSVLWTRRWGVGAEGNSVETEVSTEAMATVMASAEVRVIAAREGLNARRA
jgi:hypothetical protein